MKRVHLSRKEGYMLAFFQYLGAIVGLGALFHINSLIYHIGKDKSLILSLPIFPWCCLAMLGGLFSYGLAPVFFEQKRTRLLSLSEQITRLVSFILILAGLILILAALLVDLDPGWWIGGTCFIIGLSIVIVAVKE